MKDLLDRAVREEASDQRIARASDLWPKAVEFLRSWLTPSVQQQIREVVNIKSPDWPAGYHLGWGMGLRNTLREHGFGEEPFGVRNLDNIYVPLVEEAVSGTALRSGERT